MISDLILGIILISLGAVFGFNIWQELKRDKNNPAIMAGWALFFVSVASVLVGAFYIWKKVF